MAASLIARSLTVTRGPHTVLNSIDLDVTPGRRIGVVGPNGVGKSTLLGAIAGQVPLDGGTIELSPPTARVGLLAQELTRRSTETVRAFLARRTGVAAAEVELDAATAALAGGVDGADDRYSAALESWLGLGAADFDARVEEVWASLGLDAAVLDRDLSYLSGGEAARTSLASVLLSQFDVVCLDEPTNDLDLDGLDRLEQWVASVHAPLLIVSHDRTFLERTITHVVEIDHYSHRIDTYAGGWSAFVAERELARQHAIDAYVAYDSQRQALIDRAQREREWAAQGRSRVRKSAENDKYIRHFQVNQTEQLAGKAARTQRAIDRLEAVEEPHEPWQLQLTIPNVERSGEQVVVLRNATVDRDEFVLGPVDLTIGFGDRVALVGSNGAGKTSLIDLMVGRVEPTSGSVELGRSVAVGELDQSRQAFTGSATFLDAFMAACASAGEVTTVSDARRLLAKFGLGADHVLRPTQTLSPGERTRAGLALLMRAGANLLVLDEPTNHLDIEAIEQLEQALETFAGTVVLVTHDRSLLDRVEVTRTIELDNGTVTER